MPYEGTYSVIQSGGFRALPGRCGVVVPYGSRPTGVWSVVLGEGSEGLGLSGQGSMDTFVSRPAVGESSPFMGCDSFKWMSCQVHRSACLSCSVPPDCTSGAASFAIVWHTVERFPHNHL